MGTLSRNISFSVFTLLVLFFSSLMLMIIIPYLSFRIDVDFLLTKQGIIHLKHWRYAFYIHVITSIFAMLAGIIQFSNYLLKKYKKIHRLSGYLYVLVVVVLSGPSGLIMSFYANGGVWAKASFVILSLLWIIFTLVALAKAKQGNFASHKKFMIRSYALTLSAVSLRVFAYFLPGLTDLNAKESYVLLSWTSWTVNLLIAELIIFYRYKKSPVA